MKEISLNAMVETIEGEAGESTHVVINPLNQQVTHFVVQVNHEGQIIDHLVPLQVVTNTSHDRIWVQLTLDEFLALPRFTSRNYLKAEEPESDREGEILVTTPAEANLNLIESET